MLKRTVIVKEYAARGGPRAKGKDENGNRFGPTDAGEYVVQGCWRHSSRLYPEFSTVLWGSELKEENGELVVQHQGKWQNLKKLTGLTKENVLQRYKELYGVRKVPDRWVFNDFGHKTCYIFKDKNGNRRLDSGKNIKSEDREKIHGEFFHTTPDNEAEKELGRPVVLTDSHGCVHVRPLDIDDMIKRKFLVRGNSVKVHGYDENVPKYPHDPHVKGPYTIHFYPGSYKVIVTAEKMAADQK